MHRTYQEDQSHRESSVGHTFGSLEGQTWCKDGYSFRIWHKCLYTIPPTTAPPSYIQVSICESRHFGLTNRYKPEVQENHQFFLGLTSLRVPSGPFLHSNSALALSVSWMGIQILSGSKPGRVYEHHPLSQSSLCTSSDGPQPHFITIEFPRKVAIQVMQGPINLPIPKFDKYIYHRKSVFTSIFLTMIPILLPLLPFVQGQVQVICKMCEW
jgi:hypothetical protein